MNRFVWLAPIGCLGLVLASPLLTSAQEPDRPEDPQTVGHMQAHLERISAIKDAILAGRLRQTREPAAWLAAHEPMEDLPLSFEPFVLSMRGHAEAIVAADDIPAAAAGVTAIANDCGGCHIASEIDLEFGYDEEPPSWSDLQSHMQRHLWAIDRLWEGLIGPSDASWSRGIRMLAEAPLLGTEATWDEEAAHGDELAHRVHDLGRQAASALTPLDRAEVYSEMIGVCAECHTRTGGGPGT